MIYLLLSQQELKTPDVFRASLPGLLLKNDCSSEIAGKVLEAESKARIIHYESKEKKKNIWCFPLTPPPPPTRKSGEKVLCHVSLLHEFQYFAILNSMRFLRPNFVIVFPVQFILNVCLLNQFLLISFLQKPFLPLCRI